MSSDRIQDLTVSAPDTDAKNKHFHAELSTHWSTLSSKIAGVNVVAHETIISAARFMALPVATAATAYAFFRDFHSLTHSTSANETLKDYALLQLIL